VAYIGIDDTLKQTYGYAKQGACRGYTGVKGLNALVAIVSTPSSAPGGPTESSAGRRPRGRESERLTLCA
jgi:hypothetical protein